MNIEKYKSQYVEELAQLFTDTIEPLADYKKQPVI